MATPGVGENGAGVQDASITGDVTVLSTTGASIMAMVIACLAAAVPGMGVLLLRSRDV